MGAQTSTPSTNEAKATTATSETPDTKTEGEKPKCKPCCACPETRKARDLCIVERGEEECAELIEAHKECMRKLGYVVG